MKSFWSLLGLGILLAGCKKEATPVTDDVVAREPAPSAAASVVGSGGAPKAAAAGSTAAPSPSVASVGAVEAAPSSRANWDAFAVKHPEAKGLMTLLPAEHRKNLAGFGRANLPAEWAGDNKAAVGKPAFVAVFTHDLDDRGTEAWFVPDDPIYTWTGTLSALGSGAPRKAVVKFLHDRGAYGGSYLIIVETPDKLVQGAFWYDGSGAAGYPLAVRVVESRDKKQAVVVAYLGGADRDDAYDQVVLGFVGGQFKPVSIVPTDGGRPESARSCKDVTQPPDDGAPGCIWVPPLPVVQSHAAEPLRLTLWKPSGPRCVEYADCSFSQQLYVFDDKTRMLAPSGAATQVTRALQPLK